MARHSWLRADRGSNSSVPFHRFREGTLDSACVTPRKAFRPKNPGERFRASKMLRFPGDLIAAQSAFLRRIRRTLRSLGVLSDAGSRQERDEFLKNAKPWLPWLTPSRLSYLAYFATDTPTPSMNRARERGLRFFNYSVFESFIKGVDRLELFKPEPIWIRKVIRSGSNGKRRVLHIPNVPLKHLQRFVLRRYLSTLRPDDAAYGFESGRSRRSHAMNHCKKSILVRLDIRNFFPSIRVEQVTPLFRECGFQSRFAEMLAHLVTFKGRLPQGAPTSPKIADLVARPLDAALRKVAKDNRWFFSRYADDLCFSSGRRRSRNGVDHLITQVAMAAREAGFGLNHSKTTVMRRHTRQLIVGIVVNNHGPTVPRERHRKLRALVYRAERNGLLQEGLRYREKLRAEGHSVSLREGRHPGELVRRDRSWPYSKQVPHLPRSLREEIVTLPNEQWTAVADFWHFLCGQVGELASVQPDRSTSYMNRLRRATLQGSGSAIRVPSSLEVREQRLIDGWRRISDLVAEVNSATRGLEQTLIALLPLTPADQRRIAESETDFKIFVSTVYTGLLDRISGKYKKQAGEWLKEQGGKGWLIARGLRHYFHHGNREDEEKHTAKAHQAFLGLIGKTFPSTPEEWHKCQVTLLDGLARDLEVLRSWHPSDNN